MPSEGRQKQASRAAQTIQDLEEKVTMLEATIVSQRNVIEKKDAIIAELRDRHVGGPATPCSQATDPLFACWCERGHLSYMLLVRCSLVCWCWRRKMLGIGGQGGALRLLQKLDFEDAPVLSVDTVVQGLRRVGGCLAHLDLSLLCGRKPSTWCLSTAETRRLIAALRAHVHPRPLRLLALPPTNPFSDIASWLQSSCASLTDLRLRFSRHLLEPAAVEALCNMRKLGSLTGLEIQGRFGNDACEALASALAHMSTLRTLDLRSECMGARGCRALATGFPGLRSLESLYMQVNDIGAEACGCLAAALHRLARLHSLAYTSAKMSQEQFRVLVQGIGDCPGLEQVALGSTLSSAPTGAADALLSVALASLASLPRLRDLSFYGVSLGEEAVCALSAALQLSSAASMLTAIVFSGNRLGDAACSAPLRALLQHARRLQVLDLSSNEMSGAGCTALANGLVRCLSLVTLDLHANVKLGDEGVLGLSSLVLPALTSLRTLNLAGCSLGDASCLALAQVLSSLRALELIDLASNNISDAGCVAVAQTLQGREMGSKGGGGSDAAGGSREGLSGEGARGGQAVEGPSSGHLAVVCPKALIVCPMLRRIDLQCNHRIGDAGRSSLSLVSLDRVPHLVVAFSFQFLFRFRSSE